MYDCSYKFTSKERDNESALDYFGARHYGSNLGRLMQPDEPFNDQTASDPQSWNLYSYVRNNPLRYTDPTGTTCVQDENGNWFNDNGGGQSCEDVNNSNLNNPTAGGPPFAAFCKGWVFPIVNRSRF